MSPISSGVNFTFQNGEEAGNCTILESLGGGVGILDFDLDGAMDFCVAGGGSFQAENTIIGRPTGLFHNLGDFRFRDRSQASRIQYAPQYTHGIAVGDYDNDGFCDIALTGYRGILLWTNQGDGTFVESANQLGIVNNLWSSSAAWGDLNGDGQLDLYVANYVNWSFDNHPSCGSTNGQRDICPPKSFDPLPDSLYLSQPEGTFRQSSVEAGLRTDGKGLGVLLADFDADSKLDIYVANDTTNNFLYLNKGQGQFDEKAELCGVALDDRGLPNGSMGVDIMDYNLDGKFDIWVCNYEDESFALYRNEGAAQFLHVSKSTGLTSFGQRYVGFGTACADFDLDGDEDVVVANGHVIKYPQRSPRKQIPLYLENQKGRFVKVPFTQKSFFGKPQEGRGLAVADFDNDGDFDLVVSRLNEPLAIVRNNQPNANWLTVRLIGRISNRDAIGARLKLTNNGRSQIRQIKGGGSYLSTHDLRVLWGIDNKESMSTLEIDWPSGIRQMVDQLSAGYHVFIEPTSIQEPK